MNTERYLWLLIGLFLGWIGFLFGWCVGDTVVHNSYAMGFLDGRQTTFLDQSFLDLSEHLHHENLDARTAH